MRPSCLWRSDGLELAAVHNPQADVAVNGVHGASDISLLIDIDEAQHVSDRWPSRLHYQTAPHHDIGACFERTRLFGVEGDRGTNLYVETGDLRRRHIECDAVLRSHHHTIGYFRDDAATPDAGVTPSTGADAVDCLKRRPRCDAGLGLPRIALRVGQRRRPEHYRCCGNHNHAGAEDGQKLQMSSHARPPNSSRSRLPLLLTAHKRVAESRGPAP